MKFRLLLIPALCALVAPLGGHANAAPACAMLNWRHGDWCSFEAPAREFVFGGIATEIPDGAQYPWVAVQVVFNGQVLASCYGEGSAEIPARCTNRWQAFVPDLPHQCYVFGTGGPKAYCVDPPPLPVPLSVAR